LADPIVVEILRGGVRESAHRAAVAVCDGEGRLVLALGDVERPVFPRSAVKAIQALPLIESGAADRFGLSDAEIALACASHSGEPAHVETAASALRKAGRDEGCLECGAHWPTHETAARVLAASGRQPDQRHNNCSGKHAGFICVACAEGVDPAGYVRPEHTVQRQVRAALEDVTGVSLEGAPMGIDGCSIPTFAIPLRALARGFARYGTGHGLSVDRARAAARIRAACAAHPFMVAGSGSFDTRVMEALRERAFIKTGAEGVYCGCLPELGLGVAIKADDGAGRAAETVMAAIILAFLDLDGEERGVVAPMADLALRNWKQIEVGRQRATGALAEVLRERGWHPHDWPPA
jgi:L-asparaginase II